MSTPDILKRILGVKREEVAAAQAIKPLSAVRAEAEAEDAARDFVTSKGAYFVADNLRWARSDASAVAAPVARDILLFASNGKTVRFGEDKVRSMGRTATGVRGIKMAKGEEVVSLIVAESAGGVEDENEDESGVEDVAVDGGEIVETADDAGVQYILTATENGYGKRTPLADYPRKGRGTQGVIGIQTSERNGKLVGAVLLGTGDEVLLISDGGTLVRTRGAEISRVGRNTQGVTLIRLSKGEKLQAVERLDGSLDEEADAAAAVAEASAGADTAPPPAP